MVALPRWVLEIKKAQYKTHAAKILEALSGKRVSRNGGWVAGRRYKLLLCQLAVTDVTFRNIMLP
jgi:predicted house-cleaning NTP pyrophosphatase (Maf/HAM1 superfamily)